MANLINYRNDISTKRKILKKKNYEKDYERNCNDGGSDAAGRLYGTCSDE